MDYTINRHPEFRYKTEFQSHEPEVIFFFFFLISFWLTSASFLCHCMLGSKLFVIKNVPAFLCVSLTISRAWK